MPTYYALGNLNHDGREFARGDEVTGLSEEQADVLLADGVIGDIQPTDVAEDAAPLEDISDEDTPIVGGTPTESGEPTLDNADASGVTTAENDAADVSNPDGSPKPGFLARLFGNKEGGEPVTFTLSDEDLEAHPVLAEQGFTAGQEVDATQFPPELVAELEGVKDVSADL